MNVLSLFDGISVGQAALNEAGIKYDLYLSSEIDKNAIKITQKNFPGTIQIGDVRQIKGDVLTHIDLVIGGSPCQGFSFAGQQLNFVDERSRLFFEYVRILNEIRKKNPDVKFLLENVKMKKQYQDIITSYLGVEPIEINSKLFVPQNRPRLYWTNIEFDMNIKTPHNAPEMLNDILIEDWQIADKYYLSDKAKDYMGRLRNGKPRWEFHTNFLSGNASCLTANMYKGVPYGVIKELGRRLHPIECERLQGLPDGYTEGVSDTERYKSLGNGWTMPVIAHIFKGLKNQVNE